MTQSTHSSYRRIVFVFALCLILSAVAPSAAAVCQVQVVSSIAPTDGGSAVGPAAITPSSAGTPLTMSTAGTSEPASDLLIYDDGAGPNCFSQGQSISVGFNLRMTSPTASAFTSSAQNFDLFDSSPASTFLIQASAQDGFAADHGPQTTLTINVVRAGTAGNLTTGPTGSAIRIKHLRFNSTPLTAGASATAAVATSAAGTFAPSTVVGGTGVVLGPVALSSTSLTFVPEIGGTTSGPRALG